MQCCVLTEAPLFLFPFQYLSDSEGTKIFIASQMRLKIIYSLGGDGGGGGGGEQILRYC